MTAAAAHIVLVHGSWHGPWVWEPVVELLAERGIATTTVDLPSCGVAGGLEEDAAVVSAAAAAVDGPVVVCAHSYGGVPTTAATFDRRVQGIVFLCAFVPAAGMSLAAHFPDLPPYADFRDDGTNVFVRSMAHDVLYGDLTEEAAAGYADRLVPQALAAVTTPVPHASWATTPSLYVVCTEDRTIPVDIQRMFAARAGRTVELATSHSPMLSQPARVADLLAAEAALSA